MSGHRNIGEISSALGISRQAARKRATRERWPYIETPVRGGLQRLYRSSKLPGDVRAALVPAAQGSKRGFLKSLKSMLNRLLRAS